MKMKLVAFTDEEHLLLIPILLAQKAAGKHAGGLWCDAGRWWSREHLTGRPSVIPQAELWSYLAPRKPPAAEEMPRLLRRRA